MMAAMQNRNRIVGRIDTLKSNIGAIAKNPFEMEPAETHSHVSKDNWDDHDRFSPTDDPYGEERINDDAPISSQRISRGGFSHGRNSYSTGYNDGYHDGYDEDGYPIQPGGSQERSQKRLGKKSGGAIARDSDTMTVLFSLFIKHFFFKVSTRQYRSFHSGNAASNSLSRIFLRI